MKLELKHIAPYLPYDIKFTQNEMEYTAFGYATSWYNENGSTYIKGRYLIPSKVYPDNVFTHSFIIDCIKPILRPLTDLTKEIEVDGEKFVPSGWLDEKYDTYAIHRQLMNIIDDNRWINQCSWLLIQHFLEWHIDIYNLIPEKLAIDINTLKSTETKATA